YHFRVVGLGATAGTTNALAAVNGADQTFTTTGVAVTAPTATTGLATQITATGAVVTGTVNPNGGATAILFEFGPTAAYGAATLPVPAGSGTISVPVQSPLIGLAPSTTYHFHIVAKNDAGTTTGDDQTFTTAPVPIGVFAAPATG